MKESTVWSQETVLFPNAVPPALAKILPPSFYHPSETLLPTKLIGANKSLELRNTFMTPPGRQVENHEVQCLKVLDCEFDETPVNHNKNCSVVLNRLSPNVSLSERYDQSKLINNSGGHERSPILSGDVQHSNNLRTANVSDIQAIMESFVIRDSPRLVTNSDKLYSVHSEMVQEGYTFSPISIPHTQSNGVETELRNVTKTDLNYHIKSEDLIGSSDFQTNKFNEEISSVLSGAQYGTEHDSFQDGRLRKLESGETKLYSNSSYNLLSYRSRGLSGSLPNLTSSVQSSVISRCTSPVIDFTERSPTYVNRSSENRQPEVKSSLLDDRRGFDCRNPTDKEIIEGNEMCSKLCKIRLSLSSENKYQNESEYCRVECSDDGNRLSDSRFQSVYSKENEFNQNQEEEEDLLDFSSGNKMRKVSSLSVYVQTEGPKLIHIECKRFRKRKRHPLSVKWGSNKQIGLRRTVDMFEKNLGRESSEMLEDAVKETVRNLVDETLLSSFPLDNLDLENANTQDLVRKFCVDNNLNFKEFDDLTKLFSFQVIADCHEQTPQRRRKYKRKSRFFFSDVANRREEENVIKSASNMDYRELRKLPGRVKNKHLRGTSVKNFYLRPRAKHQNKTIDYQTSSDSEEAQVPMVEVNESKSESPVIKETLKSLGNCEELKKSEDSAMPIDPVGDCDSTDDDCLVIDEEGPCEKLKRVSDNSDYGNSTDVDTIPELVPVIVSSSNFPTLERRLENASDITESDNSDQRDCFFKPIRQKSESPIYEVPKKAENEDASECETSSKSFQSQDALVEKEPDIRCLNGMATLENDQKPSHKGDEDDIDDEIINIIDDSTDGMHFSPNICESLLENSYANPFDSETERREREREKSILRMLLLDSSETAMTPEEANEGIPVITKVMSLSDASDAADTENAADIFADQHRKLRLKHEPAIISRSRQDLHHLSKLSESSLDANQMDSKEDVLRKSSKLLFDDHRLPPLAKAKSPVDICRPSSRDDRQQEANNKDYHGSRRTSGEKLEEAIDHRVNPSQSKMENWINDPILLKEKIKRLRNEIVYLQLIAEQKEKERVAILCFKKYKEEMLKKVYRLHCSNKYDSDRSKMADELAMLKRHPLSDSSAAAMLRMDRGPGRSERISPSSSESFVHHHPYYPLPQKRRTAASPFPRDLRESAMDFDQDKIRSDHSRQTLSGAFMREGGRSDSSQRLPSKGKILHHMLTTSESSAVPVLSALPHHRPASSNLWYEPPLKPRTTQSESVHPKSLPIAPSVITRTNLHAQDNSYKETYRNPVLTTYPPFSVSGVTELPAPKLLPHTTAVRALHSGSTVLHSPIPRPPMGHCYGLHPPIPSHMKLSMGAEPRLFPLPKPGMSAMCRPSRSQNLDQFRSSTMNKYATESRSVSASPVERRMEGAPSDYSSQDFRSSDGNKYNSCQNGPSCMSCGLLNAKYLCSGCKKHWYCSPKCQTLLWPHHSKVCPNREGGGDHSEHYM